jgi:type I restriction enzyme S subunit
MRRNWDTCIIDDVIENIFDGPHATPKPSKNGPVFLGIKNIAEDNQIVLSEIRHIAEEDFEKWTKRVLPKKDDLVFIYEATLGRYALIPEGLRCCLGRRMALLRLKTDKVCPKFLLYYFKSYEWEQVISRNLIVGATVNRIPISEFHTFPICIPELARQKEISKVLSDLDAKIELNNKINAELEAMAKLLYDYWFVQFDFPFDFAQGKPDKVGKPNTLSGVEGYKSSGGKMVYNEQLKREIPEGWEVKSLVDEMSVQYGYPFSTSQFNEDKIGKPVIRIRDILNNSISLYSTESADQKYSLQKGDLLIGMDGNFHLNFWDKDDCYLNQRSVRIRKNKESNISHFQALFSIEPYIKAREKNVSRTTVGHLSAKDINGLNLLITNSSSLIKDSKVFESTLEKIINNRNENKKLSELRDWLLPMLMNGQVTMRQAHDNLFGDLEQEMNMAAEPRVKYKTKSND